MEIGTRKETTSTDKKLYRIRETSHCHSNRNSWIQFEKKMLRVPKAVNSGLISTRKFLDVTTQVMNQTIYLPMSQLKVQIKKEPSSEESAKLHM